MTEGDKVFAGLIPEIYDTYLVPLIFQDFAQDLAERTAALAPDSVLETAAGSSRNGGRQRCGHARFGSWARYRRPLRSHGSQPTDASLCRE